MPSTLVWILFASCHSSVYFPNNVVRLNTAKTWCVCSTLPLGRFMNVNARIVFKWSGMIEFSPEETSHFDFIAATYSSSVDSFKARPEKVRSLRGKRKLVIAAFWSLWKFSVTAVGSVVGSVLYYTKPAETWQVKSECSSCSRKKGR